MIRRPTAADNPRAAHCSIISWAATAGPSPFHQPQDKEVCMPGLCTFCSVFTKAPGLPPWLVCHQYGKSLLFCSKQHRLWPWCSIKCKFPKSCLGISSSYFLFYHSSERSPSHLCGNYESIGQISVRVDRSIQKYICSYCLTAFKTTSALIRTCQIWHASVADTDSKQSGHISLDSCRKKRA